MFGKTATSGTFHLYLFTAIDCKTNPTANKARLLQYQLHLDIIPFNMEAPWQPSVDRFCRQYLQLESDPDFPPSDWLKLPDVQEAIYDQVFADGAVRYSPPVRYQHRILKNLVARIESSIDDWEEYVSLSNLCMRLNWSRASQALPIVESFL